MPPLLIEKVRRGGIPIRRKVYEEVVYPFYKSLRMDRKC